MGLTDNNEGKTVNNRGGQTGNNGGGGGDKLSIIGDGQSRIWGTDFNNRGD